MLLEQLFPTKTFSGRILFRISQFAPPITCSSWLFFLLI
jgi:hypothetical protein